MPAARVDTVLHDGSERVHHRDAIGGLGAGAIENVVEGRTFVRSQIQPGGVRHHPHAHVTRKPVCKQGVEEMSSAPENRAEYRQPAFEADEPPEPVPGGRERDS